MERLAFLQQLQRLLGMNQAALEREADCFDVRLPQPCPQRGGAKFGEHVVDASHDARPRNSPQPSSTASARSSPSAMQQYAPAASIAVMVANWISVGRPPSALSSRP